MIAYLRKVLSRLFLLLISSCLLQPSAVAQATLVSAKPPGYPLAAKAAGIDGPVKLRGIVSKEGRIGSLQILSGPPELRQAAIDAVSNWVYKPYTEHGKAVEVETTITVNFSMGKGKAKAAEQAKARAELSLAAPVAQPPDATPKQ